MSDQRRQSHELPAHFVLPEPELRFGSQNPRDTDIHPMRGLIKWGPFSKDKVAAVPNPIRVATIAPFEQTGRLRRQIRELEESHQPKERKAYLPPFSSFEKIFGIRLAKALGETSIELSNDLAQKVQNSPTPHITLADALINALRALNNFRSEFDIVVILLTEDLSSGFYGPESDDFDLHDYVKAHAASEGICIQILRESSALDYFCRCSVAWRLGIALYTKAGGIPWVLSDTDPNTAYIGIDYALRATPGVDNRFAICCSEVFDAEGSGLEFVAYEADGVRMFGKNPYLQRDQMLKVISRSLQIYQKKHCGDLPKKLVVHKNTHFRHEEIEGVFDALPHADNIELVHVQQSSSWRGVQISGHKTAHGYPCNRGTALQLGEYETLLWTQGNLPEIANGRDFYKEGKGIPSPLLLTRYSGLSPIEDLCRETLALTKMDWNNDGPYDRLPVTLNFAGTLATIVKRMPDLQPRSYPVRLFM